MTDPPTIRRATMNDVESLVRLRLALLREMGNLRDERETGALQDALRRYFAETLASGAFVAWVAEAAGQLVASSGLVFFARPPDATNLSGRDAYIMNMYTVSAWRGQGLARVLLEELLDFVRATEAQLIRLHATEAGRPLYAQVGFVPRASEMVLALREPVVPVED